MVIYKYKCGINKQSSETCLKERQGCKIICKLINSIDLWKHMVSVFFLQSFKKMIDSKMHNN